MRFNAEGSLDSSFGIGGKTFAAFGTNQDNIFSIVLQPDGKIIAGGATRAGMAFDFALVRFNVDGGVDNSFGTSGRVVTPVGTSADIIRSILLQPDGKIVAAGESINGAAKNDFALVRYNTDGSLDIGFGMEGRSFVNFGSNNTNTEDYPLGLAMQADGKLVAAGSTAPGTLATNYDFAVARFNNSVSTAAPHRTAFDFDGDGKSDISVFRLSAGSWYLSHSSNNAFVATQFGTAGDMPAPADYDGAGKTDLAVYRGNTWYLLRSTAGFTAVQFGSAGDVPQPADYDGDGRAELAVYRPTTGTWFISNLANNQFNGV